MNQILFVYQFIGYTYDLYIFRSLLAPVVALLTKLHVQLYYYAEDVTFNRNISRQSVLPPISNIDSEVIHVIVDALLEIRRETF